MRVAVISPGDMGSAIAGRLIDNGVEVLAFMGDRSQRTQMLAQSVGIQAVPDMSVLVRESQVILSVVVPARAIDVAGVLADAIARTGSHPLVLDCNAISPNTVRRIGALIVESGGRFMDASIVGRPPRSDVNTVLYASGPHFSECAALADHGLRLASVGDEVGSASALKMSYAGLTKGLGVLGVQLLMTARMNGVYEDLLEIMGENVPEFVEFLSNRVPEIPVKAHRFVGEMRELDSTIIDAGLPGGTFESIGRVCEWLAETTLALETPETRDASRTVHQTISMLAESLQDPSLALDQLPGHALDLASGPSDPETT